MSAKRIPFVILVASAALLAVGAGPGVAGNVRALPPESKTVTIPYAGRLNDEEGQPVANGAYDFTFTLYDAEIGGEVHWSEVQRGVAVSKGEFLTTLGSVEPIPATALSGQARWLAVSVRGPGEAGFTALSPRQLVSVAAPAAPTDGAACPHDHVGELWVGDPLFGLYLQNNNSSSLAVGLFGVGQTGVKGSSYGYYGVHGESTIGTGVYAEGGGSGSSNAALRANNTTANCGIAAFLTNNSGCPTLEIDKHGAGSAAIDLQLFDPGNINPAMFINAYDENVVLQFQVSTHGLVGANGYTDWGADMAEMLPAAEGLEPGDVLAIGPDGSLIRSAEAYQTSVAGVYSTDPGFMFGHPLEGKIPGTIPLAMAGVVPVKVSAENGPIHPGDLLVASSTPGHAMKASANPPQGSVIGKALEAWDVGMGTIKMLAMLQ